MDHGGVDVLAFVVLSDQFEEEVLSEGGSTCREGLGP